MKTSKEFSNNLKNLTITMDMLESALYSINKRAKNCRDKKNEYYRKGKSSGYRNDYSFKTVDNYKEKEKDYYNQKDFLLKKLLQPICIHEEKIIKENKVRYYDDEEEFIKLNDKAIYKGEYFDGDTQEYVEFIDVIEEEEIKNYYLFYETPNYSFHVPVSEIQVDKLKLEKVSIDNLKTKGKIINDLVSVQFCKKLIELVEEGNYKLVLN